MELTAFDLFLIIIISQCVFLIFAIQFIPKRNIRSNKILQYLLVIYSCLLLERVVSHNINQRDLLLQYTYIINTLVFFIGPLIYTYIRRLLFVNSESYHLRFWHFLPAIIYFAYSIFHICLYDIIKESRGYFIVYSFLTGFFTSTSILMYLIKSFLVVDFFKKNEKFELSFNQVILRYIRLMLISLAACSIIALIVIIDCRTIRSFLCSVNFTNLMWFMFGVQIYIVAFYCLKQPQIFKIRLIENFKPIIENKNRLSKKEIDDLKIKVDSFLQNNKGYLKPELSLVNLADEISSTTNNLSWLLNNIYKKTFYELINQYRIEDFLQKIKDNKHKELTLFAIASEVGFKSKSTFYRAFKEITNTTPSEYIKNL